MQTEAIFENIAERIITEIQKATTLYILLLHGLPINQYLNNLLLKQKMAVNQIIISNDQINENSSIDFNKLEKHNGKV